MEQPRVDRLLRFATFGFMLPKEPSRAGAPRGYAKHSFMEIWFNPSCSKCQAARTTVDASGEPYTLRNYLEVPPTETELDELLRKLAREPWEVCRLKEPIAGELGLASMAKDRASWIRVMVEHPILIERPILVRSDGRAVIGRSDEALADALRGSR